jgi:hypothetical protein
VSVAVGVPAAVAVGVEVVVDVAVAVAVGVAVAGGLEFRPVVKSELNPSFSVVPLAALIVPTNRILYFVFTASALLGVKVALLPLQVMLLAAIRVQVTGFSRKVCLFIDPHFIGKLKFTVTLVSTSTLTVPLTGFVDSTMGRGIFDSAAAREPPTHTINISAVIESRLTKYLSIIVPSPC